jgi:hypothetical protein
LEILFGRPEGEFLLIEVLSRSYPNYTDDLDGNWLNARVVLSVGGFKGQVGGYLRAEEFLSFRDEIAKLNSTLSGKATFLTMEEWISINITGDGKGHVMLKGQVRDQAGTGNTLNFTIELDQTFLPGILKGLDKTLKAFPVLAHC